MKFLFKPHQFSKTMRYCEADSNWWDEIIANPPVIKSKDKCPLAIFGTPVPYPEKDPDTNEPRCTGANVDSIYALSLDYDSQQTIDNFMYQHRGLRYSLYTSYSYGVKPHDRFRVVVPLAKPLPCELLQCRRVKTNLLFHWPMVDECCFDRGHWQILPVRNPEGRYEFIKNHGDPWTYDLETYREWMELEKAEREARLKAAAENADENTQERIRAWTVHKLAELEVGAGTRYAQVKSLLAWAMANGLGDSVLTIPCPWEDEKWQKRWPKMTEWASTLA